MSAVASVTFAFDGTEETFAKIYDAICDLGLDIGAYHEKGDGTIEYIVDDFAAFQGQVARRAVEIGIPLAAVDYLRSEGKA